MSPFKRYFTLHIPLWRILFICTIDFFPKLEIKRIRVTRLSRPTRSCFVPESGAEELVGLYLTPNNQTDRSQLSFGYGAQFYFNFREVWVDNLRLCYTKQKKLFYHGLKLSFCVLATSLTFGCIVSSDHVPRH
jgi:hypothetical protein